MLDLYRRRYDPDQYTCGHFVLDFLKEISNETIKILPDINDVSSLRSLRKLESPVSPCIVMMRTANRGLHCGVFYLDKVIHLVECGVRADQLSDLTEFKIGFYQCQQ